MNRLARLVRPAATGLFALFAATALASPASAHDQVIQTTPGADQTVTTGTLEVEILTSGELLDLGGNSSGFAITVTDERGLFYGDGCVLVDGPALSTTAPLGDSGDYTVTYQYVSGDGHTLSGQYNFVFERPEDYLPAAGQSQAPVCGQDPVFPLESTSELAEDEPDASPQDSALEPAEEPAMESSGPSLTSTVIAGIAIVLLGTMSYLFIIRQRSQRLD